ncbi:MAG TPA: FKBP-type peptidyl-prolyl cis-trans isomerase [Verrucomicrobiae bacterium]|nr:FKBP-type peptidyl-prolyl cis-trans isomerase [Verrucomicrobiae bacterium]
MRFTSHAVLALALASSWTLSAADTPFKSSKEKASYALGANIGKQLKQNGADIDTDIYMKALKEGLSGAPLQLTDEQIRETLMAFQTELRSKTLEKNKKDGDDFLRENKKKEGIVSTPSGLQYQIVTKGSGKMPTSNDMVVCHYRGTLISGDEFDSSYKRSEPASFSVTGVIKGWTEALLMMPVGSKWKLFIPSDLAYGERGRPGIPPNSALLFDIELVSIKDPSEAASSAKPGSAAAPRALPGQPKQPSIQVVPQTPPTPPKSK